MHFLQTPHNLLDIRKLAKHINDGNLTIKNDILPSELYFREAGKSWNDLIARKAFPTTVKIFNPTIWESLLSSDSSVLGLDFWFLSRAENHCL